MPTIYLDGKFKQIPNAELKYLLPGLIDKKGAFETMRVSGNNILFYDEHFKRFQNGLKKYRLRPPFNRDKSRQIIKKILRANNLKNARVRVAVWTDDKRKCAVVALPCPAANRTRFNKGYKVCISETKRNRNNYSHLKSMKYGLFYRALNDAKEKGYDEALLFNRRGNLVEGAHTNVFIVKNGKVFTPSIENGCLKGITRQNILKCAKNLKIEIKARDIKRAQLLSVDEIFLTNSLLGVMPVTLLDGRKISGGRSGNVTKTLNDEYQRLIKLLS